jgi:hypothetical protein
LSRPSCIDSSCAVVILRAISASRIWIACVRGERLAEQHARLRVVEQLREHACAAPITPHVMP